MPWYFGGNGVQQGAVAPSLGVPTGFAATDQTARQSSFGVGPNRNVDQTEMAECRRRVAPERPVLGGPQHEPGAPAKRHQPGGEVRSQAPAFRHRAAQRLGTQYTNTVEFATAAQDFHKAGQLVGR